MKILIIACHFPPFNIIGSIRLGKIAKYLSLFGHDVKILTLKKHSSLSKDLSIEIDKSNILYTDFIDFHYLLRRMMNRHRKNGIYDKGNFQMKKKSAFFKKLLSVYKHFFYIPDEYLGWLPYAFFGTNKLFKKWRPDFIYASAMPFTTLMIGYLLHKRYNIPWIAELRDLWTDNHYYNYSSLRLKIEKKIEYKVLRTTTGIVTVSDPLAEILRAKYSIPIEVIMNGFDEADCSISRKENNSSNKLKIVYTGSVYQRKRDPSNFLKALQMLKNEFSEKIKVFFYGPDLDIVPFLSKKYSVQELVEINTSISYQESLKKQREADILLLILWNDPSERGVYTGKIFEYLGSCRPILAMGYPKSVAAELIIERQAGVVLNDPKEIAEQLKKWLIQTQEKGRIPDLPSTVNAGLSRREQTKKLEQFMLNLLNASDEKQP